MDSKIWNLEIVHADPKIVKIIDGYFPTGNISIGTLFRKLPFILMDLVEATSSGWKLVVPLTEDPEGGLYLQLYETTEDHDFQSVKIKYPYMPNIVGIMNNVFAKDRWIKFRTKSSVIDLNRQGSSFRYERKLHVLDRSEGCIYSVPFSVFVMTPVRVNFFQKIWQAFVSLFTKSSERTVEHQVVSFTAAENGR